MTTARQRKANKRNARYSTGPRSSEGKQRASQNALRHGLLAAQPLIPGEDPEEFAALVEETLAEYSPAGPTEEFLVSQLITCMWRYRRFLRVEAGIFESELIDAECRKLRKDVAQHEVTVGAPASGFEELRGRTEITDQEAHDRATERFAEAQARRDGDLPRLGRAFANEQKTLSAVERYRPSIMRDYYKAYHELERRRRGRAGEIVDPPIAVDVNVTSDESFRDDND